MNVAMYFSRFRPVYIIKCSVQRRSSSDRVISKLLVANRGEIACRIMRTAHKLGLRTVAVYSDADTEAMHVAMADEAYRLGPAPSQESYLRQDQIIKVATISGCQAVHPGYGFLSENAEFAELCQVSGLVFIGPPAGAIRDMGLKSTSKALMAAAGVPVIQGYHGNDQTDTKLRQEADKIGFPVMIKAVRGGGGKGMRIVLTPQEFEAQLQSARREASQSFGDDVMLVEKFVEQPRHVEVQVFGDSHGNYVHLFERDCSVQRRHQKIIEEAPAPGLSEKVRAELGQAAVRAAQAVNYVGAGTVEFILDQHDNRFYFMEMNTRLQVEHPVTEMITGTDLVHWQIQVASGGTLPLTQDLIKSHGHAFEARIYAENPDKGFLPGAGSLTYMHTPVPGDSVRVETGVCQGDQVSVHYDPMISKLVVWGKNRTQALLKLRKHLADFHVAGVDTNINFLLDLTAHEKFLEGNVHTGFIQQHQEQLLLTRTPKETLVVQAAVGLLLHEEMISLKAVMSSSDPFSPFSQETGFRVNHFLKRRLELTFEEEKLHAEVTYTEPSTFEVRVNSTGDPVRVKGVLTDEGGRLELHCHLDKLVTKCWVFVDGGDVHLFTVDGSYLFRLTPPRYLKHLGSKDSHQAGDTAVAPMPGVVDKVWVAPGDSVQAGDPLMVLIAMKMEHIIRAPRAGIVAKVLFSSKDNVGKNSTVVTFQPELDSEMQ
uniref:Uncharacterized protein n=2 Tax=Timema tahoe TaxID=61484 RepID=A0A7R9IF67_9NEOP|nr:unnamed protein product [Timema tahoe]